MELLSHLQFGAHDTMRCGAVDQPPVHEGVLEDPVERESHLRDEAPDEVAEEMLGDPMGRLGHLQA